MAESLYRGFNPAQLTLDSHADHALQELGISNHLDNVFIRQVLYGVVRYRQFLGSLMDSFYYYNRWGLHGRCDNQSAIQYRYSLFAPCSAERIHAHVCVH